MIGAPLPIVSTGAPSREHLHGAQDRLDLIRAIIAAPNFPEMFRPDIIEFPPFDPVWGWACSVRDCEGVVRPQARHCRRHQDAWQESKTKGLSRSEFESTAKPVVAVNGYDVGHCIICPDRPAKDRSTGLCTVHYERWRRHLRGGGAEQLEPWAETQTPVAGYGPCIVQACRSLAKSPVGLCIPHAHRYWLDGKPGGATLPRGWGLNGGASSARPCFESEQAFRVWVASEGPVWRAGTANLIGLGPLISAEIKWGLHAHTDREHRSVWSSQAIQQFANLCRRSGVTSMAELAPGTPSREAFDRLHSSTTIRMIISEIGEGLRLVYFSPGDMRRAGFIETEYFGRRFPGSRSHIDLRTVEPLWLRDLVWDHFAELLKSSRCPRTRGPFDNYRRAAIEFGAFLRSDSKDDSADPTTLTAAHAERFAADMRYRERHGMKSLGLRRSDGTAPEVTALSRRIVFNHLRAMMLAALESRRASAIGMSSAFVMALPVGGPGANRSRSPFTDEVAAALSDVDNLRALDEKYDPHDTGLRDAWEAIMLTGRRSSEILNLRLDCIAMHHGMPFLWHDQTKVGRFDAAIRIPERLYDLLDARREKTLRRFEMKHDRGPTPTERPGLALFPTIVSNPTGTRSISYGNFSQKFRAWVGELDIGPAVAHQARHTLATSLLRAGANLAHIKQYLGQVSERMAEHYTKVSHSDLEDVLQVVWVAGPGSADPGTVLSHGIEPLSRDAAQAMAIDLSRTSTPTEGGFCTYQPVVSGGACPWNLDCENCDRFVMSGADLVYWRRKEEQWRSRAERAPDDETAEFLHKMFEPTATAIRGLETALAALGLLEEALSLDMRRPQDYFQRVWSTAFRASDLAAAGSRRDEGGVV